MAARLTQQRRVDRDYAIFGELSYDITPQITVTVSIGAAESNGRQDAPEHVVQAADRALYGAKAAGRDRVHVAGADAAVTADPA